MQNPQNGPYYTGFGYVHRTGPLSPLNTSNQIGTHYSQVRIKDKNFHGREEAKTPRGSFSNIQQEEWVAKTTRRVPYGSIQSPYGQKARTSPQHRVKIQEIGETADAILERLEMRRSGSPRQRSSDRLSSMEFKVDAQYFDLSSVNKLEKVANDLQERIKQARRKLQSNLIKRSTLSAVEVSERQHKQSQQLSRSAMDVLTHRRMSLTTQIPNRYFLVDIVDGYLHRKETVIDHTEWLFRTANRKRITGQIIYKNKLVTKQVQQLTKNKNTVVFEINSVLAYTQQTENNDILIKIRPFAQDVLKNISAFYNIVGFTNKRRHEIEPIIRQLDPEGAIFRHLMYIDDCRETQYGEYVKDVQVLGQDINKILLVDSNPTSLFVHVRNSVPVFPYGGDLKDTDMKKLEKYLIDLLAEENVVEANSRNLRLDLLLHCKTIDEYIEEIKSLL